MSRYVRFRRGAVAISFREQLDRVLRDSATVADYDASLGVTGTTNASAWANQIGVAGPLLQATGSAQPIVLPYTGEKYAYLSGVAGNYFNTPDSVAASITGDLDIRVVISATDWTPSADQYLAAKWGVSGQRSWALKLRATDGKIEFLGTANGTTLVYNTLSSVAPTIADGAKLGIRLTRNATTGKENYYTSIDDGATWVQLGTEQTTAAGALFDSAAVISVGALSASGSEPFLGKVYRAQIYNGIDGALAVDFNAADWPETSTNAATATSSTTGEVWTLNNTGAKLAQIVGSAQMLFDGTVHWMAAEFTLVQPETIYLVGKQVTWTDGDTFFRGASETSALYQSGATPGLVINAGTPIAANNNLTLNTYAVITIVFNGASSSIKVDATAATTGNAGTDNMDGLVLAAYRPAPGAYVGNIQVKRVILRAAADSAATQAQIQALLKSIYGTP